MYTNYSDIYSILLIDIKNYYITRLFCFQNDTHAFNVSVSVADPALIECIVLFTITNYCF